MSSFSKEMTNGDYVYIKRDNQYYKFIKNKNMFKQHPEQFQDVINFIEQNIETLRAIINDYEGFRKKLILDERVYSKQADYTNKNIRMNGEVYKEFVEFCKENYPYLMIQDLVAQSLLDFINRYKNK